MIEISTITTALDSIICVEVGGDYDDAVRDYLVGMLQDEDAFDDLDGLIDTVQSLMNIEDRSVAERLVRSLTPSSSSSTSLSRQREEDGIVSKKENTSSHKLNKAPHTTLACHCHFEDDSSSSSSSKDDAEVSVEINKTRQKAKRQQKKQRKKQQRKSKMRHRSHNQEVDAKNNDLHSTVAKINAQSAQEIDDLDDYSSVWKQIKSDAAESGEQVAVWGGRGAGGRGVNRGKGTYRGNDAVVHQLTLGFGGRDLLRETHLAICHGHRYGLMGHNGVGKSTLLRRIAAGSVPGWPMHLTVEMVEQEILGTPQSAVECMHAISKGGQCVKKRRVLEREIVQLEAVLEDTNVSPEDMEEVADRLSELYDQLESGGDNDNDDIDTNASTATGAFAKVDARARKILKGLQFKESMLETPGNVLSGGWRMRLALAEVLYSEPNIILLDEPTNHLDLSAVLFLENYLVEKDMTVVVVSHDGHFLDAICTDMIKFEDTKLKYHVGNYSSFCEREEQAWARSCSKADAVARQEKKAKDFIQKQRSMANSKRRDDNKLKQAAERQKKLGRIGLYSENGQKFKLLAEGNTKRGGSNRAGHIFANYTNARGMQSAFVKNEQVAFGEDRQQLNFKFLAAPPLKGGGTQMIAMEGCRFRYDSADSSDWLLEEVSLNVSYGSRVAIVGKNGAGKSTLLKIMNGELTVNDGEFHRHPNLKVAHIAQHHIEQLGLYLQMTPVDYFMQQHRAKNEQEARQFLGGFGLIGPLALQKIGTLSGGQKARLAFATVMCAEPHAIILDEPTNHLDRDSLESLAVAIEKFQGAVVLVSHNQDFVARCADEMWTVGNGRVKVEVADGELATFDDLFENYKEGLRNEGRRR